MQCKLLVSWPKLHLDLLVFPLRELLNLRFKAWTPEVWLCEFLICIPLGIDSPRLLPA